MRADSFRERVREVCKVGQGRINEACKHVDLRVSMHIVCACISKHLACNLVGLVSHFVAVVMWQVQAVPGAEYGRWGYEAVRACGWLFNSDWHFGQPQHCLRGDPVQGGYE